jgi:hypothetical protein
MTIDEYCDWLKRFDPRLHIIEHRGGSNTVQNMLVIEPHYFLNGTYEIREKATPPKMSEYDGQRIYIDRSGYGNYVGIGTLRGDMVVSDE